VQSLELNGCDVKRDDIEAASGEHVRRPTRVRADIQQALAGREVEAGE
jgi:hypothetical protein